MSDHISDQLQSWADLSGIDWSSLLIGNGASVNMWHRFAYNSLYELAKDTKAEYFLSENDQKIFASLGTHNFEYVLECLDAGQKINHSLNLDIELILASYHNIRRSLVGAVHAAHIPWAKLEQDKLGELNSFLSEFLNVYSTNYDLILYWIIMHKKCGFRDYFFNGVEFDVLNTQIKGKKTAVHYLHGGLHLFRRSDGTTLKRQAEAGKNLLDAFSDPVDGAESLFVSEGSASEKLFSIYRSQYLSFAYTKLNNDHGPLVVFGHSLGESDKHIANAIARNRDRPLAISILPGSNIIKEKGRYIGILGKKDIAFFDATTFPLGDPTLRVEEE